MTHDMRTRLHEELATLTKELESIGVHDPKNIANWVEKTADINESEADPNDVADRTEEWDERRATLAVLETRYNDVRRALAKIDAGTFGTCELCGSAIERDRLDANPAARTCKADMDREGELVD